MTDLFTGRPESYPAEGAFSVTPSDTGDFNTDAGTFVTRALYIGTAGDLKVLTVNGQTVKFAAISGILPVRVTRVFSTDTTASDIVGLY